MYVNGANQIDMMDFCPNLYFRIETMKLFHVLEFFIYHTESTMTCYIHFVAANVITIEYPKHLSSFATFTVKLCFSVGNIK